MRNLPYASTVETEKWEERKDGSVRIDQVIYVERDSQKKIVLGKGGQTIKLSGQLARAELEKSFERRVHLFLFVKVRENWAEDPERLRMMGLECLKSRPMEWQDEGIVLAVRRHGETSAIAEILTASARTLRWGWCAAAARARMRPVLQPGNIVLADLAGAAGGASRQLHASSRCELKAGADHGRAVAAGRPDDADRAGPASARARAASAHL